MPAVDDFRKLPVPAGVPWVDGRRGGDFGVRVSGPDDEPAADDRGRPGAGRFPKRPVACRSATGHGSDPLQAGPVR